MASVRHRRGVQVPGLALALAVCACCLGGVLSQGVNNLSAVQLQPGFRISYYVKGTLENVRSLAISGASKAGGPVITYVSTRDKGAGKVYALVDKSGSGTDVSVVTLLSGMDTPCGIAWHKGSLYVSHWVNSKKNAAGGGTGGTAAISRLDGVDGYALSGKPYTGKLMLLTDQLPAERAHAVHYLRLHPDGKQLYVPQGAPCNICLLQKLPGAVQYSTMMTFDLDSKKLQVFATGIRNSVGFDFHPDTKVLYFADNGRDEMREDGGSEKDRPDCELNAAPRPGMFFGYPFCQGNGEGSPYLRNPGSKQSDFWYDPTVNLRGKAMNCSAPSSHVRPLQPLGPHVAPLGLRFYRRNPSASSAFPERYHKAIFIALHGSWNRAPKNGYKLMVVRLDGSGRAISYEKFASFLYNEGKINEDFYVGRPVDVEQLPDGSLLVSDDKYGKIYRITYSPS